MSSTREQFGARLRPLTEALVSRVRLFAEAPEMLAIQATLPPSFIGLGVGLVVLMLFAHGTLLARFSESFTAAFGAMSGLLVVLLAFDYARRRGVPRALGVAVTVAAFAISLPYQKASSFVALTQALGASGLFLAIGIGLGTIALMAALRARLGAAGGYALGAAIVIGGAAALLAFGFSLTGMLDRAISPLGNLGDSLEALVVITLVETLLWLVGIHGPALLAPVVLPVYIRLQLENTTALAHNHPLPHIVTVSMFLFVFPGGAGATLPLVALLTRTSVKRVRRIALATLLPGFANVNEPLMFGVPLVLNPTLGVPFVVAPLALAIVSYEAVALGFVARPAYYIPSVVPVPVNVFLATRDWRSVILMLVDLALATAIYAPFVRAFQRSARDEPEVAA